MGVYSISNREVELTTRIIECAHEPGLEGAYHIVAESEANYNAIMQAVGVAELAAYEATGEEMVYEAGDIEVFFTKMKEYFLNILEKIKGLFKKFFAMLDTFIKSDKDFASKYRKQITGANANGLKFKGYKFDLTAINLKTASANMDKQQLERPTSGTLMEINDYITRFEDKAEILELMRAKALSEGGHLSASEFTKKLFTKLRSGEDSKTELTNIKPDEELTVITTSDSLKKTAQEQFDTIEKEIKEIIKTIEKDKKELKEQKTDSVDAVKLKAANIKAASVHINNLKNKISILQVINGAKLTAIKDRNRQAKAICVALVGNGSATTTTAKKDEKKSVAESFIADVVIR